MTGSRGLRATVVRALARVGLVWALAVLAAFFVATGAAGPDRAASSSAFSVADVREPRTAGLVLLLFVLAGGATVLVVGTARAEGLASDADRRHPAGR
jgi:hypothetical protein